MDIGHEVHVIRLVSHELALEPSAKKRAVSPVSAIEALGVRGAQVFHRGRQIAKRRPDQQEMVIRHQRIGVHLYAKTLYHVIDGVLKIECVVVIQKYLCPVSTAVHDMVPCAPVVFSDWSRHEQTLCDKMSLSRPLIAETPRALKKGPHPSTMPTGTKIHCQRNGLSVNGHVRPGGRNLHFQRIFAVREDVLPMRGQPLLHPNTIPRQQEFGSRCKVLML